MYEELVAPLATATLGLVGFVAYRFVYRPLADEVDEAMTRAEEAYDKARDVERRHERQRQLLVGADADADRGVLVRLEKRLQANETKLTTMSRLLTELTYNIQQIRASSADLDDADFDLEDLEGDGGIRMTHLEDDDFGRESESENESENESETADATDTETDHDQP